MPPKKPEGIRKAIAEGNKEHLRAAGRKGAEVTNRKKDLEQTLREIAQEERELEDRAMREAANEHIIDADGEDQDYYDDLEERAVPRQSGTLPGPKEEKETFKTDETGQYEMNLDEPEKEK